MRKQMIAVVILSLLMVNVIGLAFNVQPVRAAGTIYIRSDGSIDPVSAPISTSDNVTYLLMNSTLDSIVIERSYIVFHGNGFIVQGQGGLGTGIELNGVANVTVEDVKIVDFSYGVHLLSTLNSSILVSNLTSNLIGILVDSSSNNYVATNYIVNCSDIGIAVFSGTGNTVEGNHVSGCGFQGIQLGGADSNNLLDNTIEYCSQGLAINYSSYNRVKLNDIRNNTNDPGDGIFLTSSPSNTLTGNTMTANSHGVGLAVSNESSFYHNNLVNNTQQVYDYAYSPPYQGAPVSCNSWDNGYPSCGNYWSNYTGTDSKSGPFQNETDSDGVGDSIFAIDADNVDNYPLVEPWTPNFTVQNHMVIDYSFSPLTLDPACAYDTGSLEAIMNVYEPLIFFDEDKTDRFVPRLATNWLISPDGLTFTFNIRQGVKFHDDENLTAEDVEYSLERIMVIEDVGGPAWMFYEAFFNVSGSQDYPGHFIVTGQQIDDAVTRNETAVTLHLAKPYPPFMQMLSQPWASILCKGWCTQIGDWPRTYDNWTLYNRPARTAIENQTTGPPGPRTDAMCGTGPFMLDYCITNVEWQLLRFDNYWGGWPAPGASGSLRRVTVKRVDEWQVRKEKFLDGEADYTNVPRTAIDEVLEQPGIRSIYPLESLTCEAVFFTFNISTSSPFMGVPGGLPESTLNESGIPPDFFTDINVRKGFAYAFNYSELIAEALLGEAYQPATPIIPGLPFYNPAQEKYSTNLEKATQCFSQAWGGQLWSSGFSFTLCYNEASAYRKKTSEIIKASVESLNSKFHIYLQPLPGNNYTGTVENREAPIFSMGWLADYADPHNFAYGFMYSEGAFPSFQAYSNSTIDTLVVQGVGTTNDTERAAIYRELQKTYHDDCPSFPTSQPFGRRFERTWVQGWYYNPLLAGNYFYTQWKASTFPSTRYPWSMFHHDAAHTGCAEGPAPETNRTQWNYSASVHSTDVAVVDGKVYLGSYGNISCLDACTGSIVWNYSIAGSATSPAVVGGRLYAGTSDGQLYCLDASSGARIWNYTTSTNITEPTIANGKVIFGSQDYAVYCLDALTGSQLWNISTWPGGTVSSPLAVAGDKVYAATFEDGSIRCLDVSTGWPVWNYTVGGQVTSSPAVADGKVYVESGTGNAYCLDACNGSLVWSYVTNETSTLAGSCPAIAEGKVYVGVDSGLLYCLDALTGAYVWSYPTGGYIRSSPAVADGKVYVGSDDGRVYCLNASTGVHVWDYLTGGTPGSPAIADGVVYVSSCDNTTYAFGNVIRVPEDFKTIQEAINAATPGATIWVAPGIYNESLVINKTICLIGKRGSSPTFKGGGGGIAITLLPSGSGSIIAGVVITNWDQGIFVYEASGCQIYDNIMSLMSKNGIVLEGANASGNQVCYNIFEQNTIAINLTSSAFNNTVSNNIMSMGNTGIKIESDGNTVCANIIAENELGIDIASSNNKIYHNNFMSNVVQLSISTGTTNAWDDGYPSGGNFWLNKVGEDDFRGPQQDIQGSDGIFDTPYCIASDNVDNYPLIRPFSVHNVGIMSCVKSKSIVGESFTLRMYLKIQNLGMYNETFTMTTYANTTLISKQTIDLTRRNSGIYAIVWNTAGFAKGNYTISVVIGALVDETETADNAFSFNATVVIPGDITTDGVVDILDAIVLANAFNASPGDKYWNPDADINDDDIVDILDAIVLANHFGEQLP